jgi:hypothetical protein
VPTYLQLRQEPVWIAQYVPGNLDTVLIQPLRTFFGLGPAAIGAPGDNNHLYGRHRSANWDRTSTYCTNRSYGTTDARDKRGDQNWYRAVDVGITGQKLYNACHRIDLLVRAGKLPGLAEWFGTFDGQTVVGWYEGHPSSSDDSHLWHLHVGLWNEFANDENTLHLLYDAIIGGDDMTPEEHQMLKDIHYLLFTLDSAKRPPDSVAGKIETIRAAVTTGVPVPGEVTLSEESLDAIEERVDKQLDEIAD